MKVERLNVLIATEGATCWMSLRSVTPRRSSSSPENTVAEIGHVLQVLLAAFGGDDDLFQGFFRGERGLGQCQRHGACHQHARRDASGCSS